MRIRWVIDDHRKSLCPLRSMLSTRQAAEYLGVSVVTLRLWVKQGESESLPHPGGRLLRFYPDELDKAHGDINNRATSRHAR